MALERCPDCNGLGGHLDGCSKAPKPSSPPASLDEEREVQASRLLMTGALWFFGGIIFTFVGYFLASVTPGQNGYFVTYGAIIYGGITMLRGFIQGFRIRSGK
jgi:hypothetical protein